MTRTENGNRFVPLQVTLIFGLLLLIPTLKIPHTNVSFPASEASDTISAFTEDDYKVAILTEIVSDYKTFLSEDDKAKLPGQIVEAANRFGYDPYFVAGLIETESSFNNHAVSTAGARGLLQLVPSTAQALAEELGMPWRGAATLHDPEANLELGLYYLRKLEERFGSLDIALAAYNMGPSLLEQKMASGFRPRGFYAGKVNAAYREYLSRADDLRGRVVAEVRL